MRAFTYEALPARVVFGPGASARIGDELDRLGIRRVAVLATPTRKERAGETAARLGDRAAGVYAGAVMHTPVEVTADALGAVRAMGADGLLAVGGGSVIGLGKALALRTGLPQVAVPTTYAGSEMTPILGETEGGTKTTRRTPEVLPETVVYDVDLTLSLPPALSATSGLNAIAHGVEALYAEDANPVVSLMAEEGIRALADGLPAVVRDPGDREARSDALRGAWLCATCLGAVGMALHHKLCHALGGAFDLPHAETHAVVLPHAAAYNAPAAPEAMAAVARALGADGADDAPRALHDLARRLGAPPSLAAIGMPEDGIDRAADIATRSPYPNPRPVGRDAVRALIADACHGRPPASSVPRTSESRTDRTGGGRGT